MVPLNALFTDKLRSILTLFVCNLVALLATQALFFFLQKEGASAARMAVATLLRQEAATANLFLITRSLSDLRSVGLIDCLDISSINGRKSLVSFANVDSCSESSLFLTGALSREEFESINGEPYMVQFRARNGTFFNLCLWLTRTLAIAGVTLAFLYWRARMKSELQKQRSLKEQVAKDFKIIEDLTKVAEQRQQIAEIADQVAHDIRSPLSAIQLITDQIASLSNEHGAILKDAAKTIQSIANSLLNQRCPAKGPVTETIQASPIKIESIARSSELHSELEKLISLKRIEWSTSEAKLSYYYHSTNEDSQVVCEIPKLRSIVSNVINNSFEATRTGFITVSLDEFHDHTEVVVRDSGNGIDPQLQSKLGNEEVRSTKENGTGIGLYMASKTVKSWNGSLDIKAAPHRGTCVRIKLLKARRIQAFGS